MATLGVALLLSGVGGLEQGPARSGTAGRTLPVDTRTGLFLDRVSLAAGTTAPPSVGDDQFAYVRSYVIGNEGRFGQPPGLGRPHERQTGSSQGPDSDHDVIREYGQDWPLDYAGGAAPGPRRPTYGWFKTLPTDPVRLLAELRGLTVEMWDDGSDAAVFSWIGDLASETVMPPETAASP